MAQAPPATATSPDGSITYTATDSTQPTLTIGSGPALHQVNSDSFAPPLPGPRPKGLRSTGMGSAGKRQRRGGFLGFLGRWFRFRIAMGIIVLMIAGGAGLFINSNSTSAGGLDPGDCFELPDTSQVSRVTNQDCTLPHEAEVCAEVTGLPSNSADDCFEAFRELAEDPARFDRLPKDVDFSILEGKLRHSCIIESRSGQLVGSVLD